MQLQKTCFGYSISLGGRTLQDYIPFVGAISYFSLYIQRLMSEGVPSKAQRLRDLFEAIPTILDPQIP